MQNYVWELRKGSTLLGTLTWKDQDMPWFICDFVATPEFEPYRDLFEQEARLDDSDHYVETFEALYAQIGKLNLSLHINDVFDDENVYLLHIDGSKASFRPLNSPWTGGWVDKPLQGIE